MLEQLGKYDWVEARHDNYGTYYYDQNFMILDQKRVSVSIKTVFTELGRGELKQIISLMYDEVREEAAQKGFTIDFGEDVSDFILEKGYDQKYGARQLRRTIQTYVEDGLTEQFFRGGIKPGDRITARVNNGAIEFVRDTGKNDHTPVIPAL